MRKSWKFASVLAVVALVAAGCGDDGGSAGGGDDKTLKIGFIGPITGALAAIGTGMRDSAALAVKEVNEAGGVNGWTLEFEPEDDAADAKQGATAAQKLASESNLVAVIGTFNSSVAQAVQPVLDQASILQISPGNTNPSLTMGLDWQTAPERPHANYFRVVATDREQGQFAAQQAAKLGRKRAVVIHDKKTYGQGLAAIFTEAFQSGGGTVVETLEINPGEGDYKSAVTKARGDDPDIIYYGGEFPEAGVIAKNMAELGLKAPDVILMGGDGIVDGKFIEIAGADAAAGHYATLVGATAEFLPDAATFVSAFEAEYGDTDFSAFGPPSYDTAQIIITALRNLLTEDTTIDTAFRQSLIEEVATITHAGVIGETAFDEFGDTTNKLLTVNTIENGEWKALEASRL